MKILVEAAVESLDDALAAVTGGADRLELCADLDAGGTTPARALISAVRTRVQIPVLVMVRPRAGDFAYSRAERDRMRDDVAHALDLDVAGLVLGALGPASRIDAAAMRELLAVARGIPVTFHRAIDETPDLLASIDTLASLGVARVLSSGGAASALEGAEVLREMVERAPASLNIVAGGGVRAWNVASVVQRSGVREVHARCGGYAARIAAIAQSVAQLA